MEVLEHILDFLFDDWRSLRACSLTCVSWVPRSRALIFREVIIDSHSTIRALLRLLTMKPHLGRLIFSVVLVFLEDGSRGPLLHHTAPSVLRPYLPNLRNITFSLGSSFREYPLEHQVSLSLTHTPMTSLRQYRSLSSLRIERIRLSHYSDLHRLLRGMPYLRSLYCSDVSVEKYSSNISSMSPPNGRNKKLLFLSNLTVSPFSRSTSLASTVLNGIFTLSRQICTAYGTSFRS